MKRMIVIAVLVVGAIVSFALLQLQNDKSLRETKHEESQLDKRQDDEQVLRKDIQKGKASDEPASSREQQEEEETTTDVQTTSKPADDDDSMDGQSSQESGAQEADSDFDDDRRYTRIAYDRAKESMEIPDPSTATVEYKSNIVIVTFPAPDDGRPPIPGSAFLARVKIDRETEEIVQVRIAQ